MRTLFLSTSAFTLLASSCTPPPDAELNPTWADVEPILRAQCNYCHGSSADKTAAVGPAVYRLDFYDLQSCGEAAVALNGQPLARASASLIIDDLTTPPTGERPRMPPAPAVELQDWQRDTLLAWAKNPIKGSPPADNHAPSLRVPKLPAKVDRNLGFTAVVEDADGHPVVGILRVANVVLRLDRPGSFAVNIDSSAWPEGTQRMRVTLCDGWTQSEFDLGDVAVKHQR